MPKSRMTRKSEPSLRVRKRYQHGAFVSLVVRAVKWIGVARGAEGVEGVRVTEIPAVASCAAATTAHARRRGAG